MKIAVTGHTSGIGKSISERFDVIGFSRSNGYDITKDQEKIVKESTDCDVFINNAQKGFYQTELLYTLSKSFSGKIINIGSISKDWVKPPRRMLSIKEYSVQKLSLVHANDQLFWEGIDTCILNLGYVDTPMVSKHKFTKLSTEEVVDLIEWIIQSPHRIKELSVCPTNGVIKF